MLLDDILKNELSAAAEAAPASYTPEFKMASGHFAYWKARCRNITLRFSLPNDHFPPLELTGFLVTGNGKKEVIKEELKENTSPTVFRIGSMFFICDRIASRTSSFVDNYVFHDFDQIETLDRMLRDYAVEMIL